jgi:hypothetical protein
MATKVKVTYLDGRVAEVRVTPRNQIMAERHFKGINDGNALQASYFLAWLALKAAKEEDAEYEPWLDLVDEVETVQPDSEDVDPTPSDQQSDGSFS